MKQKTRVIIALFILTGVIPSALAQDALTQTYVSDDERLTLRYPEGWVLQSESDFILVGTSNAILDFNDPETAIPAGEAGLAIVLPNNEAMSQLPSSTDPVASLNTFIQNVLAGDQRLDLDEPAPFTLGEHPAARTQGQAGRNELLLIAADTGYGSIILYVGVTAAGELGKFEPKFLAIIESVNYAPATPEVNLDMLQTITLDSAGQMRQLWSAAGHTGAVISVAISPDSRLVASGGADSTIRLWDTASGEQRDLFQGHTNQVEQVLFTPDGATLVSIGADSTLLLWDVATGEETLRLSKDEPLFYMAISPSGRWLAYTSYTQNPDSSTIESSTVWLLDMQSRHDRVVMSLDPGVFANSVAFAPNSSILMVSASDDQNPDARQTTVWQWDIERSREIDHRTRAGNPVDVFFTPGGRPYTTMNDLTNPNDLLVWDMEENYIQHQLTGMGDLSYHITLNRDGTIMGGSSYDGGVRLWDLESGDSLRVLEHNSPAYGVAFSDDGRLVATSDDSGKVYLWGIRGI